MEVKIIKQEPITDFVNVVLIRVSKFWHSRKAYYATVIGKDRDIKEVLNDRMYSDYFPMWNYKFLTEKQAEKRYDLLKSIK